MILLLKDVSADSSVHSTQWVVQQVDICVHVEGARQTDPRALATTEAHTTVPYQSQVTMRHHRQILENRGILKNNFKIIKPTAKRNYYNDPYHV